MAGRRRRALLLVDFLNPLDFSGDRAFLRRALRAARATARLRARLHARRTPVIYANDHWGRWTQSLPELVERLRASDLPGHALTGILAPGPRDYLLLKPRHSAFYGTPLDFLLDELRVGELVVTGIAANNCVLFTAHDAYLRGYRLWIPSDCVASERDADRHTALAHMQGVLKARIAGSRSRGAASRSP
jgi:nicotinamidase-related amidase